MTTYQPTEDALAVIRREESGPSANSPATGNDHAPRLIRNLEAMVAARQATS